MESIKFDEPTLKGNPIWKVLLVVLSICFMLSIFGLVPLSKDNFIIVFFVLTVSIYFIREFSYKHYVYWTPRGIKVRVNELWGSSFKFDRIEKVVFSEDEYNILTKGGRQKSINLEGIDWASKSKLLNILRTHTEGN